MQVTGTESPLGEAGAGMRRNRSLLGLSIREAADKAGISKNTILRIEAGLPVQRGSWVKLCRAYGMVPTDPETRKPRLHTGKWYTVQKRDEQVWYATRLNSRGETEAYTDTDVQSEAERMRLGIHGLVNHCGMPMRVRREGSRFVAFIVEIYHPTDASADPSGERFLFMLRGKVRVIVGDESFIVEEGEAACYDGTQPHMLEPLEPLKKGELAPMGIQMMIP